MKGLWAEFKAFIMRGNVVDLAVAVAVGAAFTAIVTAIVNGLINPLIGVILGGVDLSTWGYGVTSGWTSTPVEGEAFFAIGGVIQATINFIAIGLVLFLVVKAMNRMMRKQAAAPAPPPGPTEDQKLLGEIRDLLAAQAGGGPIAAPLPEIKP